LPSERWRSAGGRLVARSTDMERSRWTRRRTVAAVAAAFAFGCLPSARVITRALTGRSITTMGTGQPGASNVRHSVGAKAGAAVFLADVGKGFVPVMAGRFAGADDQTVALLACAPMAGHIAVVGGRGAATALGGIIAWDPRAFLASVAPVLGVGLLLKQHAPSVLAGYLIWAPARLLLGRSRFQVVISALWGAILVGTRLRGPHLGAARISCGVLWQRLIWDREAPPEAVASAPLPDRAG
jgi:acyl phosphate:glycerol-3-phosphate acyltransferase